MSEQVAKDLEDQGFLLIKKLHLLLVVIMLIVGAVAQVSISYYMIQDHEKRITKLEETTTKSESLLDEISYNLQNFMEANGQKYIKLN